MGFDLTGQSNNYFRNNCWYWRGLQFLISISCTDFLSEEDIREIGFNDGHFISKVKAEEIAKRLGRLLRHRDELNKYKKFIFKSLGKDYKNCWSIKNIKEFIKFCKESDGFVVG